MASPELCERPHLEATRTKAGGVVIKEGGYWLCQVSSAADAERLMIRLGASAAEMAALYAQYNNKTLFAAFCHPILFGRGQVRDLPS